VFCDDILGVAAQEGWILKARFETRFSLYRRKGWNQALSSYVWVDWVSSHQTLHNCALPVFKTGYAYEGSPWVNWLQRVHPHHGGQSALNASKFCAPPPGVYFLSVAVQVDPFESKTLKPGFYFTSAKGLKTQTLARFG
jgi:hypothetical protein